LVEIDSMFDEKSKHLYWFVLVHDVNGCKEKILEILSLIHYISQFQSVHSLLSLKSLKVSWSHSIYYWSSYMRLNHSSRRSDCLIWSGKNFLVESRRNSGDKRLMLAELRGLLLRIRNTWVEICIRACRERVSLLGIWCKRGGGSLIVGVLGLGICIC
jgi:hypothetical protein